MEVLLKKNTFQFYDLFSVCGCRCDVHIWRLSWIRIRCAEMETNLLARNWWSQKISVSQTI